MSRTNKLKSLDSDEDAFEHAIETSKRTEFADGIGKAMSKVKEKDRVAIASLAEVGGLPPSENDDVEYDVEVLSEAPEIDTTRDDRSDYYNTRSSRVRVCIRRSIVNILVLSLLLLGVAGLVGIVDENNENNRLCLLNDISQMLNTNVSSFLENTLGVSANGCTRVHTAASIEFTDASIEFTDASIESTDASDRNV